MVVRLVYWALQAMIPGRLNQTRWKAGTSRAGFAEATADKRRNRQDIDRVDCTPLTNSFQCKWLALFQVPKGWVSAHETPRSLSALCLALLVSAVCTLFGWQKCLVGRAIWQLQQLEGKRWWSESNLSGRDDFGVIIFHRGWYVQSSPPIKYRSHGFMSLLYPVSATRAFTE